ncbi:vitamin B12 transporter [Rhodothalassium salexigens DSM 2132]|nr:vitamin B12 transporter [Rhodothalassium salexigens DSM 2132]
MASATAAEAGASGTTMVEEVEEVVVTATRIPTTLGRTGASISVIDDVAIERMQARFVLDVLDMTPGLSVSQFGARGTDSSVRLRGQGPEGTLVLLDGIEVSDPSRSQTAFDFSQLMSGGLARIEVLRGSQSVLYGGDAVGGVVNITTKRGSGPATGSLLAEYGSFDTYLAGMQVRGGVADDRFGYSINAQYLNTDGFSAADEDLPGNSEGEDYNNVSSNGRFDLRVVDGVDLRAVYRIANGTLNYDRCGGPNCDDPDRGDDFLQYSGRFSAHVSALDDRLTAEMGAAYARNEREGFDDGADSFFYYGDRTKFDANARYALARDHDIVAGVDIENEAYRSDGDPVGADVNIRGYYALYQGTFFDRLTISGGVRLDDHELFGTFDTYRVTGAYRLGPIGTKLKGSYATGFRAPSLFELFGTCCGDPQLGNPDLEPEQSTSWDVGVEQALFADRLRLEATYFRIETDREIIFGGALGNPEPNYFNTGTPTTSKGVEISVDWAASETVDLGGTYTYNDATLETGERLQNRPRHTASAYVNWAFLRGRGNVNLSANHFSDSVDSDFSTYPTTLRSLKADAILRLAASFDLTERLQLSARIENLLDENYQSEAGYGTAPISAYGAIRYRF